MSMTHTLHCDAPACAAAFTSQPLPEPDARREAAEAGWVQVYTETPCGPRRRDFCPGHGRSLLTGAGLG